MNTYFDGAKIKQRQAQFFMPRDLWYWCIEHYGLVGVTLSLLGTVCVLLVISLYLGDLGARDLFIPALSDPKVWVFIIFSAVIFLFILSILLGYVVLATLMLLRQWRERSEWKTIWDKLQNWFVFGLFALTSLILAIALVILFVGPKNSYLEWAAGLVVYFVVLIPLVYFIHHRMWQQAYWWTPLLISFVGFVIFLWAGSALVVNNVTQLAGISQLAVQARYYLVNKQLFPIFRANESLWKLASEDENYAVCGYKIFQLSDVTVLCPVQKKTDANREKQNAFCVRLKSSEILTMPFSYVPASAINTVVTQQSGIPMFDASPPCVTPLSTTHI